MKISHIFWSFTIGGAETMLIDIINEQVNNNNEVCLIVINDYYDDELIGTLDPKVIVKRYDRKPSGVNPVFILKLNLFLLKQSFDVIHCHNYNIDKIILKAFAKKLLLTVHGFNRPITNCNKFNKIIAISEAIKIDLISKGIEKVDVIHNGINTNRIKRKSDFNEIIRIVCVGRLIHEIKGQDLLLHSFNLLLKDNYKASLHFIGDGPSNKYLLSLAKELNIDKYVDFHGQKSRLEVYEMLKDFDIAVQPSIHEGFGLTIAECMVAKIPVIISKASGLLEVSGNGKYCSVIEENTPESILHSIKEVIGKIQNSSSLIKANMKLAESYVIKSFDISKTNSCYMKIYNELNKGINVKQK